MACSVFLVGPQVAAEEDTIYIEQEMGKCNKSEKFFEPGEDFSGARHVDRRFKTNIQSVLDPRKPDAYKDMQKTLDQISHFQLCKDIKTHIQSQD